LTNLHHKYHLDDIDSASHKITISSKILTKLRVMYNFAFPVEHTY